MPPSPGRIWWFREPFNVGPQKITMKFGAQKGCDYGAPRESCASASYDYRPLHYHAEGRSWPFGFGLGDFTYIYT